MDHRNLFNEGAELYAQVRPLYPEDLFQYLASVCYEHKQAWDVACGSGQAAIGLSVYFDQVQATDISAQQIAQAIKNPKVNYTVQPAEVSNFNREQFDLVCVAQALHWFDYKLFWPEVKRVLKPSGIFAAWGYAWFSIQEDIDEIIAEKFLKTIEPYWAAQNKLLWDHYHQVPFPFVRLETPKIELVMNWDLNELFSYLQSWSAARRCMEENGKTFFEDAFKSVKSAWNGVDQKKRVTMDFCLLVGRNEI